MNIFFCDIMGTFDGLKDREKNVKQFVKNLSSLMKLDNLDNLFFSFISSDNIEYVKNFVNEISKYLENTDINMGIQFSGEGMLYNNKYTQTGITSKTQQIMGFIKNKKINNLYYADDIILNQKIIGNLVKKTNPEINIIRFFPGSNRSLENKVGVEEKGIEGLNKILLKYFKIRTAKKSQINAIKK